MFSASFRFATTLVILASCRAALAAPVNSTIEEGALANSRLYYLDQLGGRIQTCKTDGTDTRTVFAGLRSAPDGIAVDGAAGYIYVSNMGSSNGSGIGGSIVRLNLDGSGMTTLVAPGKTRTAKQLVLAVHDEQKKLYWGDREGMRVMRCNVDGSALEVVVSTADSKCAGSPYCKHVVGVAVDVESRWVYWTQKGGSNAGEGSIHRVPIDVKAGEPLNQRSDVQTLLTGLPEPIDMRWVAPTRTLYWTDRSNGQGGNSVNRLVVRSTTTDVQQIAATKQILYTGLSGGIGLAVDVPGRMMWATDLRGNLWQSDMEGQNKRKIGQGLGILVGIDFVE